VNVQLAAMQDLSVVRPRGETPNYSVVSKDVRLELPIRAGQKVGSVTFRDQDGVDHAMDVYSATDVKAVKFALGSDPIGTSFVVIVAMLIGGAWFVRRRAARA
jgi:hypothetical protein